MAVVRVLMMVLLIQTRTERTRGARIFIAGDAGDCIDVRQRSLPEGWWDPMGPSPSAHQQGVPGICRDVR